MDRENAEEFLCLPEVSLEMSGLFLNQPAASDPEAKHVVVRDQASFHPKPELHALPERVHLVSLPPYNPSEAIGDMAKDRIGNVLWDTMADLEQSIGEELHPLCENPEGVRRLLSHPWLVEQVNATLTENSTITRSKCYNLAPERKQSQAKSFWDGQTEQGSA